MKIAYVHICLGWHYCFIHGCHHAIIENGAMADV